MTPEAAASSKKPKNKGAKKKRHVSKHILQAEKDKVAVEKAQRTDAIPIVTTTTKEEKEVASSKKKKQRDNHKFKDVKEPAGYLSNWKNHREQWKFNKNTQSWLIRHMYEADKVAKGSFVILLEYLQGLQGGGAKQRILQEAARRALRYKQYSEESEAGGDNHNSDNNKKVQFADDVKVAEESTPEAKKTPGNSSTKKDDDATEEENRWLSLSDHDKRKEYKRARKVLETLQSS